MSRAFAWNKVKEKYRLEGDDWPECLTSEIIACLHFPNNKDDAHTLKGMLDKAVDTGVIEFNDISIKEPPCLPVVGSPRETSIAFGEWTAQPYKAPRLRVSAADWITALAEFAINQGKTINLNQAWLNICLFERFSSGLPKHWVHDYCGVADSGNHYHAIPLISHSAYAAWTDKPPLPTDSPLKYWLDIGDTAKDIDAGAMTNGELTKILAGLNLKPLFSGIAEPVKKPLDIGSLIDNFVNPKITFNPDSPLKQAQKQAHLEALRQFETEKSLNFNFDSEGNPRLKRDTITRLGRDTAPNQQPELIPDTGEGLPAKKQEREITTWLRETWINEGKPDGGEFFTRLKKYVNQSKSPIREHWTTSPKAAGLRFCTGSHSGELSKKTISNKVSLFKSQVSKKACQ